MMYPSGHYFYAPQHKQASLTQQSEGQAKATTRTSKPIIDVWMFLQLGAVTAIIVAAIVVLTSLPG